MRNHGPRGKLRPALGLLRQDPSSWRLFARAFRYRLDRNALRFTVQTIKPLGPKPDSSCRRLVLFAHFDKQNLVDPYVVYYIRALKALGSEIIFVSGSPHLDRSSAAALEAYCAAIYTQETLALDFGSWNLAWHHMQLAGWKLEDFNQLILANDSVYGPLFELSEMFNSFHGADLYGVTESLEIAQHLQSFLLVFALNERTSQFVQKFWRDFQYRIAKPNLIAECEVGLSVRAAADGLTLKPYIPNAVLQDVVRNRGSHQFLNAIADRSVNNTLFFWDLLISEFWCPLLKTEVAKNNPYDSTLVRELEQFLRAHTQYPPELITNHVTRLRDQAAHHTTIPSPKLSR